MRKIFFNSNSRGLRAGWRLLIFVGIFVRSSLLSFLVSSHSSSRRRRKMSVRGLEGLLRLCFAQKPSPSELYLMLGYN
jgi:hypothetical protein